jgi:hypothetical protein
MTTLQTIDLALLAGVTGGFSKAQIKTIESDAVKYAEHSLHTSPVFLGDVNNSTKQPTFSKRGVIVSTGDEASPQFYTGRVSIDRRGKPTGLSPL